MRENPVGSDGYRRGHLREAWIVTLVLLLERTTTVTNTAGLLNPQSVPVSVDLDRVKTLVLAESFGRWQAQPGLCRTFVSASRAREGELNGIPVSLCDEALRELLEQVRVSHTDPNLAGQLFGASPESAVVDYTEAVLAEAVAVNDMSEDGEFFFTIWW